MELTITKRVFVWKNEEYPDPNPDFTLKEVVEHYSGLYPEWVTATVKQKEVTEDKIVYEVGNSYKEKG